MNTFFFVVFLLLKYLPCLSFIIRINFKSISESAFVGYESKRRNRFHMEIRTISFRKSLILNIIKGKELAGKRLDIDMIKWKRFTHDRSNITLLNINVHISHVWKESMLVLDIMGKKITNHLHFY